MPTNNIKIFDENKTNMLTDVDYNTNAQRLNGVQSGVASSQLQNKTLYQTSLISYAIAQFMNEMGFDASDSGAVSTFVNNLSSSIKKPADSDVKYVPQNLTDAQKTQARVNINAAPGGFGLGTISQTVTDFDTVKLNGWYFGAAGTAHAPNSENNWAVRVTNIANSSEVCIQDAYTLTNINEYLHLRRLVYVSTATQNNPWEWVDPPMHIGVEYRTTERYHGKPVYVMVADFGNLPSAGTKTVDIFPDFAAEYILDVKGVTDNGVFPFSSTDEEYGNISLFVNKYGSCRVTTTTTFWGNTMATIVAKYTKSTD